MPEIVSPPSRQAAASWKENKNAFYLFWAFSVCLFACSAPQEAAPRSCGAPGTALTRPAALHPPAAGGGGGSAGRCPVPGAGARRGGGLLPVPASRRCRPRARGQAPPSEGAAELSGCSAGSALGSSGDCSSSAAGPADGPERPPPPRLPVRDPRGTGCGGREPLGRKESFG